MSRPKDDWEKPRGKSDHFSSEEIQIIREGYREGRTPRDVARELKCASRTVYTHYQNIGGVSALRHRLPKPKQRPARDHEAERQRRAKRFYHSNFEL